MKGQNELNRALAELAATVAAVVAANKPVDLTSEVSNVSGLNDQLVALLPAPAPAPEPAPEAPPA